MTKDEAKKRMAYRFRAGTTKRSHAYKAGYQAALLHVRGDALDIPYSAGSAEFDAWFSGWDDARAWLNGVQGGPL